MKIEQKGIETVFLTYANNSFRDSPENLRKVSDKIISHFFSPYLENTYGDISSSHLKGIVEGITSALTKDDSTEVTISYFGKYEKRYFQKYSEIIKEAITERSYIFCRDKCLLKKYREPLFRTEIFCNNRAIRCYECDQIAFRHILSQIANGKKIDRQGEIQQYFKVRDEFKSQNIHFYTSILNENRKIFTEHILMEVSIHTNIYNFFEYSEANCRYSNHLYNGFFRTSLLEFISYSLVEFLLHNDPSRFKHCKNCNSYYVSRTMRQSKFCSANCRQTWHNHKRIESGEAREYKRKKRKEGAKESYYG